VSRVLKREFTRAPPHAAVFCQRYRPSCQVDDISYVREGLLVELGPATILLELARTKSDHKSLKSVVFFSSVAGSESHLDLPLSYSILKSVTLCSSRILANHCAAQGIRVNTIVLGEFQKKPRISSSEEKLQVFDKLGKFSLSGQICSLHNISQTVSMLLDPHCFLTGAELRLDGGVSLLGPEFLLRSGL
jgi:NAD(P)-dependent dehydrogenase (short-subunit alcohol dehydrogenase family)